MPVQPNSEFLEGLYQYLRGRTRLMAPMVAGDDTKKLTPDEIVGLWDERAMPIEQEWNLWRQGRTPEGLARGEKPLTPEQIGLMVFPNRERLAKSGGNVEPQEHILAANRLAKRAAERRAAQLAPEPTTMEGV